METRRPPVRLTPLPGGDLQVDGMPRTAMQTLRALGGARYDPARRTWAVHAGWAGAIRGWAAARGREVTWDEV